MGKNWEEFFTQWNFHNVSKDAFWQKKSSYMQGTIHILRFWGVFRLDTATKVIHPKYISIDYCTKIETKVSPKNLLVESSKNNFVF